MKLKKIAALALAGVMAVSMLAGCATKEPTKEPTETEPTTSLSASVIAALSADTTKRVTFTESAELDKAVADAVKMIGTNDLSNLDAAALNAANEKISSSEALAGTYNNATDLNNNEANIKTSLATSSMTKVVANAATDGSPADYAVKAMAAKLDSEIKSLSNAAANTQVYQNDDADYRITYSYTGNVSVYTSTDADTGVVSYYLVYTVTRTAAAAKV